MTKPFDSKKPHNPLTVVPLGGLGEFGLNMMTYRMEDSMIVVDAGIKFSEPEQPGVTSVLPDTEYLKEHRKAFSGIVLTHGHEDHIGAIPYLLKEFNVPIYGTPLTLEMVRNRLSEHNLPQKPELYEIKPRHSFSIGAFGVELVHVTHSLADAVAVVIDTPHGKVLHTGDFKVDDAPPIGPPIDLPRLTELGKEGILCMLSDSTNAEVPGPTGVERSVESGIRNAAKNKTGKVLMCCFSSSTHRIQLAINIAAELDRKLFFVGRSMVQNINTALDLGYLHAPKGLMQSINDINKFPAHKQFVLTAGSQGEPLAALTQVANGSHQRLQIGVGDIVIFSARVIPGNEKAVSNVVNKLFRLGVKVVQPGTAQVHVSGHASADELDMVLRLINPKHFIPIHGEWKQLYHHANIARNTDIPNDNILLAENGDVVLIDSDGSKIDSHFDITPRLVDTSGFGFVDNCTLSERRRLATSGVIVPMVTLSSDGGSTVSELLSCGYINTKDSEATLEEAHNLMLSTISKLSRSDRKNDTAIANILEKELKRFFRKNSNSRPVILPVICGEGS